MTDVKPIPEEILKSNSKELQESWNWLIQQYNRKKESLEKYMQRDTYNLEYALREKAFLNALSNNLNQVRIQIQFLHSIKQMQLRKEKSDEWLIQTLFSILRIHGITELGENEIVNAKENELFMKEVGAVKIPSQLRNKI